MDQDLSLYFKLSTRLHRAHVDDLLVIANTRSQLRRLAEHTPYPRLQRQIGLVLMDSPGDLTGTN
jgi:hypothetical protein